MSRTHLAMLEAETRKLEQAGLHKPEEIHAGTHLVDLTSQDYLGLRATSAWSAAAREALERYGLVPGAPRVFTGTRTVHQELEQALARFLQVPDAIGRALRVFELAGKQFGVI